MKSYEKLLTQTRVNVELYTALGPKDNLSEKQQKQFDNLEARMEYAPGTAVRAEVKG